eukprot:TRINITY_DN3194_c0_g3_i9.p1 TRINITY_DN3194_c0_g3~~TRINITY_DN3194_c0_g3_i9.p1  ORF type:complete len:491 (-),score=49.83 TRINITY_DN3194_c0_g3_i9:41-1513(-)
MTSSDNTGRMRDFCVESHFEYGTRVGYWRIMEAFDKYNLKLTLSACGRAAERSPWVVKDAAGRGHEIAAHGYLWESHERMTESDEALSINRCVDAIQSITGKPPVGWHTRSKRSPHTRKLLVDRGFLYSDDAYNDDTPYFVEINGQHHLILPYAFDTNDMQYQGTSRFTTASSFSRYVIDAFDWLANHETYIPRMLTIGLHLRVISRPGRMPALEEILLHISKSEKAWIARREDIARHWIGLTSSKDISFPSPVITRASTEKKPLVLVINPNTSTSATALLVSHFRSHVPSKVRVQGLTANLGSSVIDSEESYSAAGYAVVSVLRKFLIGPHDTPIAIVIGCFGDPGVFALREVVKKELGDEVPVIGLAEASMRYAVNRYPPGKFAIVTGGQSWGAMLLRLAKSVGLENNLVRICTLVPNGAELAANRTASISLLTQTCEKVTGEDGCNCIILGGGLLAGMADQISLRDVPVIDCVRATCAHLEEQLRTV